MIGLGELVSTCYVGGPTSPRFGQQQLHSHRVDEARATAVRGRMVSICVSEWRVELVLPLHPLLTDGMSFFLEKLLLTNGVGNVVR